MKTKAVNDKGTRFFKKSTYWKYRRQMRFFKRWNFNLIDRFNKLRFFLLNVNILNLDNTDFLKIQKVTQQSKLINLKVFSRWPFFFLEKRKRFIQTFSINKNFLNNELLKKKQFKYNLPVRLGSSRPYLGFDGFVNLPKNFQNSFFWKSLILSNSITLKRFRKRRVVKSYFTGDIMESKIKGFKYFNFLNQEALLGLRWLHKKIRLNL